MGHKYIGDGPHLVYSEDMVSTDTWSSCFSFLKVAFHFHALEKEMATHSSVLAWRIPGTEEPGRRPSMGHTESDTTEAT